MKRNLLNRAQFIAFLLFFGLTAGLLSSCSKDKDTPSNNTHKVVFKGFTSDGSNIDVAVYALDEDVTSETSLTGIKWSSEEMTAPAGTEGVAVDIIASGKDAQATLVVQIFVDGQLAKEAKAKGEQLEAMASYMF